MKVCLIIVVLALVYATSHCAPLTTPCDSDGGCADDPFDVMDINTQIPFKGVISLKSMAIAGFKSFDNGNGKIDSEKLRTSLITWGDKFSEDEVDDAFDQMVIDDKGFIDTAAFNHYVNL